MLTKEKLEQKQISIYVASITLGIIIGIGWQGSPALHIATEPVLGLLLYSMFCQIPFLEIKKTLQNKAFFKALLLGNFVFIPLLVWGLLIMFPVEPALKLGILLVLLTPCVDYVIVFCQLGKGDFKSVLSATPLLFLFQLLLLPVYLWLFLEKEAISMISMSPFLKSFLLLIVIPFLLSVLTQLLSKKGNQSGEKVLIVSGWLPVPLMALALFIIITSQIGILYNNPTPVIQVIPVYVLFAIAAPIAGYISARLFRLGAAPSRAVAFSSATRNSLVVLPLALALPAPQSQLAAVVIVTQTITELFFELIYIKVIPLLIREQAS